MEFTHSKETEVVPASWVQDGMSYWPPYEARDRCNRAVMREETPNESWGGLYDVLIRCTKGKRVFSHGKIDQNLKCLYSLQSTICYFVCIFMNLTAIS